MAVLALHISLGYQARASLAFTLFPLWGPPLAYVVFRLATRLLGFVVRALLP